MHFHTAPMGDGRFEQVMLHFSLGFLQMKSQDILIEKIV